MRNNLSPEQWLPATYETHLAFVAVVFLLGAFLLHKLRFLTRKGSIITAVFGFFLAGFLGLNWIIPVLYFFFTSVFFTRLNKHLNKKSRSGPRNVWQVLANILPAIIVAFIYFISKNEILVLFFISLIAAVTADTWASEIGPIVNKKCLSLKNLHPANAGISGGISVAGTLAALIGSGSVSVLSFLLFFEYTEIKPILFLTLSGFLASFVDSVLGAFWEPVLMKKTIFTFNETSEDDSLSPNDLVNVVGSITAPLFFLFQFFIF